MTTRGLVALGDSITNGHGEPALGVPMQSWAQWLAEAFIQLIKAVTGKIPTIAAIGVRFVSKFVSHAARS